jgi:hypothetical protein
MARSSHKQHPCETISNPTIIELLRTQRTFPHRTHDGPGIDRTCREFALGDANSLVVDST